MTRSRQVALEWRGIGVVVSLFTALQACAPSRPEPPGPVTVTPVPPRIEAPEAAEPALPLVSGLFTYQPGLYTYEVISESDIRQTGDSSGAEARVVTSAIITLRIEQIAADTLAAMIAVDSVRTERDSLVPPPDTVETRGLPLPATVTIVVDAHGSARQEPPAPRTACAPGEPLLAVVRDLLVPMPRELMVGAAWSDTATVSVCRGGVPVTTGVVTEYEVLGSTRDADGMPLMRVARRTNFSMAGTETTEHRQVIALTGRGESTALLEMDLRGGVVRSVTREGTADVTVAYGRAITPFSQRVTLRIRLLSSPQRQP